MRLIDPKTGQEQVVPYEQGGQMFLSGQANLPKDQGVYLLSPTGELGIYKPDTVYDAVTKAEYTFPTNDQITKHELKEKYGGRNLEAAALGAADFSTMGMATRGLVGSGLMSEETARELPEHNPISYHVGGGILGLAGSAALSPESFIMKMGAEALETAKASKNAIAIAQAEGAFNAAKTGLKAIDSVNPLSVISRAGDKTFDLLANVPEAASATQKAFAKIGAGAAKTAVESSLYELGAINRQMVVDPELTTQQAMAQLGFAAVLGGGLGAAMHGTGEAISFIKKSIPENATDFAKEVAKDVAKMAVGSKAVSILTGEESSLVRAMGAAAGMGGVAKYANILMENAHVSSALYRLKAIQEKAQNTITSLAKKSVAPAIDAAERIAPVITAKTAAEIKLDKKEKFDSDLKQFNGITKHLDNVKANPLMLMDTLQASTKGVVDVDSRVASEIQASVMNGVNFLESKRPKPQFSSLLSKKEFQPNKAEVSKFLDYVKTVEDPMTVLKSLASNKISMQEMEAMNAVYPKLLDSMRLSVMEEALKQKNMGYQKRLSLGMFLGQDFDASLLPQMVQANQATFSKIDKGLSSQSDQRGIKPTQKGLGELDIASRSLLPMEKSAARMEE